MKRMMTLVFASMVAVLFSMPAWSQSTSGKNQTPATEKKADAKSDSKKDSKKKKGAKKGASKDGKDAKDEKKGASSKK